VNGAVTCWGANGAGQASAPALTGTITGLAAGQAHTCAIASGTVTCWGDDTFGQRTITLTGLSPAARIVAGANHTCTLDGGAVRCWGDDRKSQLGGGAPFGAGSNLISIGAGHDHTCVADGATDGLSCWGANPGGVVLPGLAIPQQPTPAVPQKSGGSAQSILGGKPGGILAAGRAHTCAVRLPAPPELPGCFGDNGFGQLGGATPPAPEVVLVSGLTADLLGLTSGADHACARLSDQSLKCWGRNDLGQLGNGSTTTPATPGAVFVSGR
jgi:alpha-tubulin suppressor-like RCC1 family protein